MILKLRTEPDYGSRTVTEVDLHSAAPVTPDECEGVVAGMSERGALILLDRAGWRLAGVCDGGRKREFWFQRADGS